MGEILRNEIDILVNGICANIDHGECLYDIKMFTELLIDLDKLRGLVKEKFNENQEELKNERD